MPYLVLPHTRRAGQIGRALALAACVAAVLVISAARAGAQAPGEAGELALLSSQPLGGKENTLALAVGDLNTDGYLDLVTGGGTPDSPGPNRVYFNDGTGRFGGAGLVIELTPPAPTEAIALGDMNGDGTLDIVFGNRAGANEVYLNDGLGTLTETLPFGPEGDETVGLAVGDLDGDGDLDVVVANTCPETAKVCTPLRVYWNDGRGHLSESDRHQALARLLGQGAGAVALADLDGDGDLDLIAAYQGAANDVYLNDGQGGLRRTTRTFGPGGWTEELAVGDVDDDGDLDVVEMNMMQPDAVYLNDGRGGLRPGQRLMAGTGGLFYAEIAAAVLADVDGDGALDLVAGAGGSEAWEKNVVLLNDGSGQFGKTLAFGSPNTTAAVTVGDFNADGTLDIVSADYQGAEVWVYLRQPLGLVAPAIELGGATAARDTAFGDVNGDGTLDVVIVGAPGTGHVVLLNDGKCLLDGTCQTLSFGEGRQTRALALADLDGDDDLDVVEGNEGLNYVYLNPGTEPFTGLGAGVPLGSEIGDTRSLAVADLNGDGHLDIAVGNAGQNQIYLNDPDGTVPFKGGGADGTFGTGTDVTLALAASDLDQDGYPDLVAGNGAGDRGDRYYSSEQNRIYYNDGRGAFVEERAFGRSDATKGVAIADLNRDGSLDIVVANELSDRNQVYYNDGTGAFVAGTPFGAFGGSIDVSVDDLDGDGDLDLVVGQNREVWAYLNTAADPFDQALRLWSDSSYNIRATALGDVDGDGQPDVLVARARFDTDPLPGLLLPNRSRTAAGLANDPPTVGVGYPTPTHQAGLNFSPRIVESRYITIPFTLADRQSDPVGQVVAFYSLDGGGRWLPAVSRHLAETTWLATSPSGEAHAFVWDTLASGVFGHSDETVLRLVAYAQPPAGALAGTYSYPHRLPAPAQWPAAPAMTARFRIQGTQVRVVDQNGQPLEGAYVYRLPAGQHAGAQLMPDPAAPLVTDAQGLLPGRGMLAGGDRLVALLPMTPTQPITFTGQASLYLTSAAPRDDGLEMAEVTDVGIVQLTIPRQPASAVHPLLLFDLSVSVEWDPAADEVFVLELEEGFRRASELLYDATDGQVAIGQVYILPAKSYWNRADVTLYATNGMRPSAALGGVVNAPVGEWVRPGYALPATEWVAGAYLPGQVRMGTSWDPFGEDTSDLGEEWWRALAHELGHHLLFLPDDYVGLKPDDPANPGGKRYLARIDCQGSLMTTTRDPSYSEFLTRAGWTGDCTESLAENTTGRTDWQTLADFYPMLKEPAQPMGGPSILPLDVTQLTVWSLPGARTPLPSRNFDLRDVTGERLRLPNAQVYLFQTQGTANPTDDVLVALGSPTGGGDRIKVRGAYAGDRLCLFDMNSSNRAYSGCIESLAGSNVSLPVAALADDGGQPRWAPAVDVRALTTRTLAVEVSQPLEAGAVLRAQIYPAHYPSAPGLAPTATLSPGEDSSYRQVITLPYVASDVSVRIWVDDDSGREAIAQFFLQLPWQPDEKGAGGPDIPVAADGDARVLGGGDARVLGGGDARVLGGGDARVLGGGDARVLGGGDARVLGGGDARVLGGGDARVLGGGDARVLGGGDARVLGGGDARVLGGADNPAVGNAPGREFSAPILSSDAQVVVYSQAGLFEPSGILALQVLPTPPELGDEPWLVPVGQAYEIQPDPKVSSARTIAFNYLQRDVPEGYEHTLAIYYLADGATTWQRLQTRQFVENLVVADLQRGAGAYVVMSTVALPALQPGWNMLAYPLPDARALDVALASLAGRYRVVYTPPAGSGETALLPAGGVVPGTATAAWLATLETNVEVLEFGKVYLIEILGNVPVTPYLAPPRRSPDGVVPGSN